MASQFPPKKNTAFTLFFTLYKDDATIIANPGIVTKKVSIDGAVITDIAAAVIKEDTTYGQCSLVIADAEMNGDAIWIYIKDDTAGCIPFTCTLYTVANTQDEIGTEITAVKAKTDQTVFTVANQIDANDLSDSISSPNAKTYTLTINSDPCVDALVIMSTDSLGEDRICSGRTNALGQITLYPDLPAGTTVYLWSYKTGVTFENPDEEVI